MRIVLVHDYLRSSGPSGENLAYEEERDLLRRFGHEVTEFTLSNDALEGSRWKGRLRAAMTAPWSFSAVTKLKGLLRSEEPEVIHVHNTFPLFSPSVFYAAHGLRCATVMTLHNYRIFCAAGVPLRGGRPCVDCLDKHSSLPALRYGCYRESHLATLPLSLTVTLHRLLGTWQREVDGFICLTEFQRGLMAKAGLAEDILFVKPHCYLDAPTPLPWADRENKAVFIGRLGREKGVGVLLEAWRQWGESPPLLEIIGDGPEELDLRAFAQDSGLAEHVVFRGRLPFASAQKRVSSARMVILPSISYEGFPMVIREAFALGVPVVGSRIGSIQSLVSEGVNGTLFQSGEANDLLRTIRKLWCDDETLKNLSLGARATFDAKFTPDLNHRALMKIYGAATERRRSKLASRRGIK
jgi:glycosyltransferase involved in cell wall biosynthesis